MLVEIGLILAGLVVIVLSAELFTNGIEWLGQRLQLSEGVVGSVLAAVGTALPETLIPFCGGHVFRGEKRRVCRHRRDCRSAFHAQHSYAWPLRLDCHGLLQGWNSQERIECESRRNRSRFAFFFTAAYTLAMLAVLAAPYIYVRYVIAIVLFLIYPIYVWKCFQHEGEVGETPEHLFLDRLFKCGSDKLRLIIPQIILGLTGIIGGAFMFVDHVDDLGPAISDCPLLCFL